MVTDEKVQELLNNLNTQKEQGVARLRDLDNVLENLRVQREQLVAQWNAIEGAISACNTLLKEETVIEKPTEKGK